MKLESSVTSEHIKKENFKHPCLVKDNAGIVYVTVTSLKTSINDINNQIESDAVIIGGPVNVNAHIGFFVRDLNLEYCVPYYGTIKLTLSQG